MNLDGIVAAIDARRAELRLSERKMCLNAGVSVAAVKNMRNGHQPRADIVGRIESALSLPSGYLLTMIGAAGVDGAPQSVKLDQVFVRGAVQAGLWQEAIEWNADDWYPVSIPRDEQYRSIEHFGLEVRGTSMNHRYPPGTVLVCIKFRDIDDTPRDGDDVICLRRSRTGEYEATVKEYRRDGDRHVLWPRSHDPEHQQPIILHAPPRVGAYPLDPDGIAQADLNGDDTDDGGEPDLVISALVVQYIRTLDRRPRGR